MKDGFRLVFFSLVFTVILAGVIVISLSDSVKNMFSSEQTQDETSNGNENPDTGITFDSTPEIQSSKVESPETIYKTEKADTEEDEVKIPAGFKKRDFDEEIELRRIRWQLGKSTNLRDYYLDKIQYMRTNGRFNPYEYITKAFDAKTLQQIINDSTSEVNTKSERDKIRETMNFSNNRGIVKEMLELLESSDKDSQIIAYNYFYNNVFLEIGELIISKIVENPNYGIWFTTKTERCRIRSIFQIFTYYASQKTFPMFLFAYQKYLESANNPEYAGDFNSFFAGITSHVPFDTNIADIEADYWKSYYDVYFQDIHGLQLSDDGKIVTMKPSGGIDNFHSELSNWKLYKSSYRRFPRKTIINSDGSVTDGFSPSHQTFVPNIVEILNGLIADEIDNTKLAEIVSASDFLTDVSHPVLAETMYQAGLKLFEYEKFRQNTCEYFSKVANVGGYGQKFARKYLQNKFVIDDQCRNMLIALDDPDLIEELLKYEETDENWATVMVRLTKITFGSLIYDKDVRLWKEYFKELQKNSDTSGKD